MEKIVKDTISKHKIMLDENCKMLISHYEMLSRIIKEFVVEAKHLSVEEIAQLIQNDQYFHRLNNENTIPGYGTVKFDFFCFIDIPQLDGKKKRIYINVEIQNNTYTNYSLITRGKAYISRIQTTQWNKEYDDQNYDGMKKVYSLWILPQAAKMKDGFINVYKTGKERIVGDDLEKEESYDKGELVMIYLSKEHDTTQKYSKYDKVLTPLVAFFNNVLDLQEKKRIMKRYGFKKVEREVGDMCDYGNMIEKESVSKGIGIGVEQGKQSERISNIKRIMVKLKMSFKEATDFLDIPEDEVLELEEAFNQDESKNN